jgi:HNH endonuclease
MTGPTEALSSDGVASRKGRAYRGPYAHRWTDDDYLERWYARCVIAPTGCILWTGPVNLKGYAQANYRNSRSVLTRLIYRIKVGPIPPGMHVCHTCDVRNCINHEHLWLGTPRDNMRDKDAKGRNPFTNKTHCKHGHEFTPENTYWKRPYGTRGPSRNCRACRRERQRRYAT